MKHTILGALGVILATSGQGLAKPPLPAGKPAGVRQAMHERNAGLIFIGTLGALAIGIVLVTTNKDHPVTPSTSSH